MGLKSMEKTAIYQIFLCPPDSTCRIIIMCALIYNKNVNYYQ